MQSTEREPYCAGLIVLTMMLSACSSSNSSPTPTSAATANKTQTATFRSDVLLRIHGC